MTDRSNTLISFSSPNSGSSNKLTCKFDGTTTSFDARQLSNALTGSGDVEQQNVIFVSKAGSDSNSGRSFGQAKLTFTGAHAAALENDVIVCLDAGQYQEDFVISKPRLRVFAPSAVILGTGAAAVTINSGGEYVFGVITGGSNGLFVDVGFGQVSSISAQMVTNGITVVGPEICTLNITQVFGDITATLP